MGNFGAVLSVVHQKKLKLLLVVDKELVEAVWQQVAGGLIRTYEEKGRVVSTSNSNNAYVC